MNNCFFYFVVTFVAAFHLHYLFCLSQDLSGYISIDCGSVKSSSFKGLEYSTDTGFINSGENHNISATYTAGMDDQMLNLRSFPVGNRNCYNLSVAGAGAGAGRKGKKYIIRAHFLYGNYDGKNVVPEFDLYLGVEKWSTINTDKYLWVEIIYVASSDYVYVCLVNTDKGIPYISALELRPMNAKGYTTDPQVSLQTLQRSYFAPGFSSQIIRYQDDIYDRRWSPFPTATSWKELKTTTKLAYDSNTLLLPPSVILQSAVTPKDNDSDLTVNFEGGTTKAKFSFSFYFCEVEEHPQSQSRVFDIYLNGLVAQKASTLSGFLSLGTANIQAQTTGNHFSFTLRKSAGSAFPPLLSAVEMYNVTHFFQSQTYENDVFAVGNIKATYGLNKPNWQGDPCLPRDFMWEGLDCVFNQTTPPRIKYLDLSSSGVSGSITQYLSGLESLEFLDLSNNKLSGPIPDFLAELPSLKVLNISGNNFDEPVPQKLTNKANDGSLLFRFKNADVTKEKQVGHKPLVKILPLSFVALLLCLAIALFIAYRNSPNYYKNGVLVCFTKQKDVDTEDKSDRFTMAEIRYMTKKFKKPIGKGGFGQVYRGTMTDGTEVAVKLLSSESSQGHHQLEAEVKLLKRASHQNLTPILGYCDEGKEMAVVYKYMPNGSLNTFLSTDSKKVLTWRQRLSIASGAAQGLNYLHECNFIHRDVKPENILLDEKLEAKLGDYGLVREFKESSTHATTSLQGTHGYVDPEYGIHYQLREKSDVYSMGVVLLRLITGKPIGVHVGNEEKHITLWLKDVDVNDDKQLKEIVDPKLEGNFDMESVKKAFILATKCASPTSDSRPNMSEAVKELEGCLKLARGQC